MCKCPYTSDDVLKLGWGRDGYTQVISRSARITRVAEQHTTSWNTVQAYIIIFNYHLSVCVVTIKKIYYSYNTEKLFLKT